MKEEEQLDFTNTCDSFMSDVRKHVQETLVRARLMRKERIHGGEVSVREDGVQY